MDLRGRNDSSSCTAPSWNLIPTDLTSGGSEVTSGPFLAAVYKIEVRSIFSFNFDVIPLRRQPISTYALARVQNISYGGYFRYELPVENCGNSITWK